MNDNIFFRHLKDREKPYQSYVDLILANTVSSFYVTIMGRDIKVENFKVDKGLGH